MGVNDGTGVDVRVWGAWVVAVAGIGVAYFLVAVSAHDLHDDAGDHEGEQE